MAALKQLIENVTEWGLIFDHVFLHNSNSNSSNNNNNNNNNNNERTLQLWVEVFLQMVAR